MRKVGGKERRDELEWKVKLRGSRRRTRGEEAEKERRKRV